MIPDGWVLCSFGDIVIKSQYGLSVPSSPDGKYYIFKMNNFKDGKMNPDKVDKVNLSDTDLDKFTLKYGDLLVNRTNSIDLVGKTGVFDLEGIFTFASYLVRFQVKRAIADPFFVNFFFNWSKSQKKLKEIATLGVSQANINPTSLQKYFKLLLPPLPEQCKIAEILGAWDEAISTLEKLITAKRKLKQGLMQQLLTGKKRFKEFEGSEWTTVSFEDVLSIEIGGTPSRGNPDYWDNEKSTLNYWLSIADLKNKYITETKERITELGVRKSNTKLFPTETVVMSFKLTVGRAAILKKSMYTNEAICSLIPKYDRLIDTEFLYQVIGIIDFGQEIDQAVKGKTLNKEKIKRLKLRLPTFKEQEKIASVLSAADTEISNLEKQLAAYKQQKRGLMQQLLTGKTRVNVN